MLAKDNRISVVGIAGPGDPFATPSLTLETLRLVHEAYPEMLLCVASNGLGVPPHAEALAKLQVSHVTLTVNAVDPQIGAKVYAWIRDGKKVYRGLPAAELLWNRQAEAIRMLKQHDVVVKINTIIIPGVNDDHVVEVARRVAELGADIANCVPLYPVAGTPFGELETPAADRVAAIRADVAQLLPIMSHCTRCRADAVGLLGEAKRPEMEIALLQAAAGPLNPAEDRPYVAVATLEGVLVNQHLGEADQLSIYAKDESGFRLVEQRPHPAGRQRFAALDRLGRRAPGLPGRARGQRRAGPAPGPGQPGNQARDDGRPDRRGARRRLPRRRDPRPLAEKSSLRLRGRLFRQRPRMFVAAL